jgi:hypothetical protein
LEKYKSDNFGIKRLIEIIGKYLFNFRFLSIRDEDAYEIRSMWRCLKNVSLSCSDFLWQYLKKTGLDFKRLNDDNMNHGTIQTINLITAASYLTAFTFSTDHNKKSHEMFKTNFDC